VEKQIEVKNHVGPLCKEDISAFFVLRKNIRATFDIPLNGMKWYV